MLARRSSLWRMCCRVLDKWPNEGLPILASKFGGRDNDVQNMNKELEEIFGGKAGGGLTGALDEHSSIAADREKLGIVYGQEQGNEVLESETDQLEKSMCHEDAKPRLSHVDQRGKASMVDTTNKIDTVRVATASARVLLGAKAFAQVANNTIEKGDILTVAKIAGINAAKHTPFLIPLCHNINMRKVDVTLTLDAAHEAVHVKSLAKTVGVTGSEMEALVAASVAALTIYDMCKAVSKSIIVTDIQLDHKMGGKSGEYKREGTE